LEDQLSLVAAITSDVTIDTNLYEKTFPFSWKGSVFLQTIPPPPSPMENIFKVFDIYSWALIVITQVSCSLTLLFVVKFEERMEIQKVEKAIPSMNW